MTTGPAGQRRRNRAVSRGVIASATSAAFVAGIVLLARCARDQTSPTADAPAVPAGATSSQPATVRIGAWNIEWLGTPNSRSGPAKGKLQTIDDLADYVAFSNVSILALAEVARNDDGTAWKSDLLTAALLRVGQKTGGDWDHVLFPAHSGRNQLTGVAWDKRRVSAAGRSWLIPVSQAQSAAGKPLWSRPPYAQKFSMGPGLTDIVVVPLHMKSDTGGDFADHRGEECDALVAVLAQAQSTLADEDFLFIGDSNCGEHAEPGVVALTGSGFLDLNAADAPTHIRYGALDRAFVPANQPEFNHRFEVLRDNYLSARGMTPEDFKVRLSDHFMIVTEVTVSPDDD